MRQSFEAFLRDKCGSKDAFNFWLDYMGNKKIIELAEEWSSQQTEDEVKIDGNTSDGYHTFNELYDHRVLLWINLCLLQHPKITYLVENHFDGWFLLGVETPQGQLSYHCPNKYLHLVENIKRRHPKFDGHTSNDVLKRLEQIAILTSKGNKDGEKGV